MVKNLSGKPLSLLRWTLLPDGKVVAKFTGKVLEQLPAAAAQSPQARRLADERLIEIEGYTPPPPPAPTPPPAPEMKRKPVKKEE